MCGIKSADKLILYNHHSPRFSAVCVQDSGLTTDYTSQIKHPYVVFVLYAAKIKCMRRAPGKSAAKRHAAQIPSLTVGLSKPLAPSQQAGTMQRRKVEPHSPPPHLWSVPNSILECSFEEGQVAGPLSAVKNNPIQRELRVWGWGGWGGEGCYRP